MGELTSLAGGCSSRTSRRVPDVRLGWSRSVSRGEWIALDGRDYAHTLVQLFQRFADLGAGVLDITWWFDGDSGVSIRHPQLDTLSHVL